MPDLILNADYQPFVYQTIDVSNNDTNWVSLWDNGGSEIADNAWTEQVFDLSAVADGESTVYLRWTMGSTDSSWQYCGWNIDDITLWGFQTGDNAASSVGKMFWFGPMKWLQRLMFHTPLVNIFIWASAIYHDYVWYPNAGRKVVNEWLENTPWGRLFEHYQVGTG